MTSRLLAGLLIALVAVSLSALTVLGHAELVTSDPADGGTLPSTPYTMTLEYDEPLDPDASSVLVRDSSGAEVAAGGLSDEDEMVMTVELPELSPGEYTVRWTAVTPDDNGVERGTLTFTVAEPGVTQAPSEAPVTSAPSTAPTVAPTPISSPEPIEPAPSAGNDLLIALLVAGIAVAGVLGYLYFRNRP